MSVQSERFAAGCVNPLHATFDKSWPSLRSSTMRLILISHLLSLGTAGQIHPASEPAARPEGDGAARRGLPLLQAHAGEYRSIDIHYLLLIN